MARNPDDTTAARPSRASCTRSRAPRSTPCKSVRPYTIPAAPMRMHRGRRPQGRTRLAWARTARASAPTARRAPPAPPAGPRLPTTMRGRRRGRRRAADAKDTSARRSARRIPPMRAPCAGNSASASSSRGRFPSPSCSLPSSRDFRPGRRTVRSQSRSTMRRSSSKMTEPSMQPSI